MIWQCRERRLDLERRPLVMGILNVTPDSFSDGGLYAQADRAIAHGLRLVEAGADILDIGGESTRPGAPSVTDSEQIRRVIPVVEGLRASSDVAISVDTTRAEVARHAIGAGADIINDVTALRGDPELVRVAADSGAGVVLMHMLGTPQTMQLNPQYDDVVTEVATFLSQRSAVAESSGVGRERIVLDPGIGFGKTLTHNLELLRRMTELLKLGRPILVGPSRKNFIGELLDLPVDQRVEGTAAAVAAAIVGGARIVRVHDVAEMVRVARVAGALSPHFPPPEPGP